MKFAIYLLALLVVLGGLFVFFKPEHSSPPTSSSTANGATPTTPGATVAPPSPPTNVAATTPPPTQPTPQVFDLVIRRGQLVSGPAVIQVHKGDEVIIRLASDASDELHLHGYDLHAPTRAGQTTALQFTATRTGRFGYELHHAKTELGALEVYPR